MSQLTKVGKSNDLIEASYRLSLVAQRVFILLLSKIDTMKPLESSYSLTAKEYSDTYGVSIKISYRDLEKGVTELYETDIKIRNQVLQILCRKRIANEVTYHYGKGKISISFPASLAPHLCEFKKRFTIYTIGEVSTLKSAYSIRLYELLVQFRKTGDRCVSVESFRKWLGVGNNYPRFGNLKGRVITPSVKELNLKTKLQLSWEPIKNGRKVESLSFAFEEINL